jgi:hypothetical protein
MDGDKAKETGEKVLNEIPPTMVRYDDGKFILFGYNPEYLKMLLEAEGVIFD